MCVVRTALCTVLIFGLIFFNLISAPLYADEINDGVYDIKSKPNGFSYPEWVAKWWPWFSIYDESESPATDTTGERCALGQDEPQMWLLILTFGGEKVERTCTIPSNTSIFVPLLANDCDQSEKPSFTTREEFIPCAVAQTDYLSLDLGLVVDGVPMKDLKKYYVESTLFNVTYPELPAYNVKAGTYLGAAVGYFVILEPLSIGNHEILIDTVKIVPPGGIPGSPSESVSHHIKYNLIVK